MITIVPEPGELRIKSDNNVQKVYDVLRKKWIVLTPEEFVRQLLIHYLHKHKQYPLGMMAIEKQITLGKLVKRYDLVVFDRAHQPWMLIECKAPEIPIDTVVLQQLLQYHNVVPCKYWLLSNGHQNFCARFNQGEVPDLVWLHDFPAYNL